MAGYKCRGVPAADPFSSEGRDRHLGTALSSILDRGRRSRRERTPLFGGKERSCLPLRREGILALMPSCAEGTPLFLAQKRPELWQYAGDTLGVLSSESSDRR